MLTGYTQAGSVKRRSEDAHFKQQTGLSWDHYLGRLKTLRSGEFLWDLPSGGGAGVKWTGLSAEEEEKEREAH